MNADILPDGADTRSLGSAAKEWLNIYIGDAGKIYFGLAQDVNLYRSAADILKTDDALDALALKIGGTQVISLARALANVTAHTSIITSGEFAEARIPHTFTSALNINYVNPTLAFFGTESGADAFALDSGAGGVSAGNLRIIDLNPWTIRFTFRISTGDMWIAGKLTQAGCLPKGTSTPDVIKYLKRSQKRKRHETQTEVDALVKLVLYQEKRIKELEARAAEHKK